MEGKPVPTVSLHLWELRSHKFLLQKSLLPESDLTDFSSFHNPSDLRDHCNLGTLSILSVLRGHGTLHDVSDFSSLI